MEKVIPEVGTKLYLSQRTGDYWVDMVKRPYTVVGYRGGKLLIQEAKCNFPNLFAFPSNRFHSHLCKLRRFRDWPRNT